MHFIKGNIIKLIALLVMIIGFSILLNTTIIIKKDIKQQDEIIKEVFSDKIYAYNNTEHLDVLGYIELPKYDIRRIIKMGTSSDILDSNYVGIMDESVNLDSDFGNIILAGHDVINVFGYLHKMKIGDEIVLETYQKKYFFEIISKNIVDATDSTYLKKSNEKILTLITCTAKENKRLIVVAKCVK